jgi:hypothetical protein
MQKPGGKAEALIPRAGLGPFSRWSSIPSEIPSNSSGDSLPSGFGFGVFILDWSLKRARTKGGFRVEGWD